jgi:hypothetical protein
VEFGVSEYTLVFRRVLSRKVGRDETAGRWMLVRPLHEIPTRAPGVSAAEFEVAEVFIVPFCSTLALDDLAYERFLRQSGVLDEALECLHGARLLDALVAETLRKEIQSLVMAAEVQYIVDGMSA